MTESPNENEFYTFKGFHCGHADGADWTMNGTEWADNDWECEWKNEDTFTGHVNKNGKPLTASKGPMDIILKEDIERTGLLSQNKIVSKTNRKKRLNDL